VPAGTVINNASYTGAYQSKWDDSYNFFVIERDKKLYVKNTWGVTEIELDDSYEFFEEEWGVTGQFDDYKNGQFQGYTGTVDGQSYAYKRVDIDTEHSTYLFDKSGTFNNFSEAESAGCDSDYSLDSLAANSKLPEKIEELIDQVRSKKYSWAEQDSLLVYKDNKLVVEEYFNGYTRHEPHSLASVSKSLTSLLVGSLVSEGKISDINLPMATYLPEYKLLFTGDKANITFANFMNMSAGIEWDRYTLPFSDPNNVFKKWELAEDKTKFTLSRKMQYKPGERFVYSNGGTSVIGAAVEHIAEQNVAEYALQSPLSSLCFKNAFWAKDANGRTSVAGGAMMRPMDMLKLGQLMLDKGKWQGQQIIDKQWVNDSLDKKVNPYNSEYGLFWWRDDVFVFDNGELYPIVRAEGWAGQEILIIEQLNLVVVVTSSNGAAAAKGKEMLREFIIPAFVG
jgi:CubicO group peptidase (beta-lactamase class C family)